MSKKYIIIIHIQWLDFFFPPTRLGQVILDKNPGLLSVVNKTNIIDSTYRNFQMEVLAGEENMMTKVSDLFIQLDEPHHVRFH